MATVIDSLVVRLGLDAKDFEKSSKQASQDFDRVKNNAQRTGKDIERSGQQGAEFFNQLRKSAVAFFSVLTVGRGLADFTRSVIGTGAQLDRMAGRIGESASQLSRWQGAVKQSGGTSEGFLSTLQNISNQFTQLKETGDAPMRMLLNQLGVSAADASGKAKPILQLLRDIGDQMDSKQWSQGDKFNKLLAAGFDEGTINLLLRGRQEREKLLAAQKEYSDADAKAAREAQENWEKTKAEIEKTTQTLLIKLLPTLQKLADSMAQFAAVAVPVFAAMVNGFTSVNDATNNWLLTLGLALVAVKGISALLGLGAGAAGGGLLGALNPAKKLALAGAAGYGAGTLIHKQMEGGSASDSLGRFVAKTMAFFGNDKAKETLALEEKNRATSRSSSGKIGGSGVDYSLANKIAAAEKANGLPPGTLASIITQETGNRKEFLNDPTKYHYGLDANGRRIAPHTGKISTAFGPFGILESTARDPGFGVAPLQNKSIDEQIRFAAEYAKARIKRAGSVAGGLAGYGEGEKYASQVIGRMGGGALSGVQGGGGRSGGVASVSVGEVNVYTQATDAVGIARDMQTAIIRQADTGMR